jgi:hypothetical protein
LHPEIFIFPALAKASTSLVNKGLMYIELTDKNLGVVGLNKCCDPGIMRLATRPFPAR